MKQNKKIMLFGLAITIIILVATLLSGCINSEKRHIVLQGFEVHEWGVFQQQYNCNVTNVANIPSGPVFAEKPVVYFHYDENITDLVVEVDFNGDLLVTIPVAINTSTGLGWTVDIINNSVVAPDGTIHEYLFYECQINVTQAVVAYALDDGANVTFYVKNIADYNISNLFFIYGGYIQDEFFGYNHYGLTYITIEKLDSGEEVSISVPLKNSTDYSDNGIKDILIELDLTEKEAKELVDYWLNMWFYPTNLGPFAQMIYIIPQKVYDEILPITITPCPEIIKRVGLFFVTDIPINNLEMKTMIGTLRYFPSCPAIGGESDPAGYILDTSSKGRTYLDFSGIDSEINIETLLNNTVILQYNDSYLLSAGGIETPFRTFTCLRVTSVEEN